MRGAPFRSWNGGNVREFVCPIFPYHTQGAFCMVPTKTQDLRAVIIINMNIIFLDVSCVICVCICGVFCNHFQIDCQ